MARSAAMATAPDEATSAHPAKGGSDWVSNLIGFVIVAGIVGVITFTTGTFGGSTLSRISMKSAPQSITLEVEEKGILQVWADIEITHREFSPNIAAVELPHVLNYVVELRSATGKTSEQHCNPFNANTMRRSDTSNSIGQDARRWYDGLVRDCGFRVEPGTYTVTAHTVEVNPDARVSFQKNDMVLRLDD